MSAEEDGDAWADDGGYGTDTDPEREQMCGRDAGERAYWMSVWQYDPCPCVRPKDHGGKCGCRDHDKPADAVPASLLESPSGWVGL